MSSTAAPASIAAGSFIEPLTAMGFEPGRLRSLRFHPGYVVAEVYPEGPRRTNEAGDAVLFSTIVIFVEVA